MTRGELWWADFGLPLGSEPGFRRPVLIVQDDAFNRSMIKTIVVIPLSTNLELGNAPGNVEIGKDWSGLPKDSVIVVSQLSAIDKTRLLEKAGKVSQGLMRKTEEGMKLVLGIEE
jgi:mRNA interferase MazF